MFESLHKHIQNQGDCEIRLNGLNIVAIDFFPYYVIFVSYRYVIIGLSIVIRFSDVKGEKNSRLPKHTRYNIIWIDTSCTVPVMLGGRL